jgi:hypothetical protein
MAWDSSIGERSEADFVVVTLKLRRSESEETRYAYRRQAAWEDPMSHLTILPGGASAYGKLTVTVILTGTATPLSSVGSYRHLRTASSAG